MRYTRLDITDKNLTREDFLNQPRKLFVLPDNLPDFRLTRNKLHKTKHRGGLAATMRPYKVGGTKENPIYDVNVVGVPTLSFDSSEPLTTAHIQEAFTEINRLVEENAFDEIVVPYKEGKPAFGGGIAGPLPPEIQNAIEQEFVNLEQRLSTSQPAALMQSISNRESSISWLDKPYPKLSLAIKHAFGLAIALAMWLLLPALVPVGIVGELLTFGGAFAAAITGVIAIQIGMKGFFGSLKTTFRVEAKKDKWHLQTSERSGAVIELFGISCPYKKTLIELEEEIKVQLKAQLDNDPSINQETKNNNVNLLTKYYAKKIISTGPTLFYREDREKVNVSDYQVEERAQKLFAVK